MSESELTDDDYRRQLEFRLGLVRFLKWNRQQTAQARITPTQHLLLLVIRASGTNGGPTVGDVADALELRHHSVVELVDRAEQAGMVERARETRDGRPVVRLRLTSRGRRTLERITRANREELRRVSPQLLKLLTRFRPSG